MSRGFKDVLAFGADDRIALRAGGLSAELAPACGGRLALLRHDRPGGAIDLVPPLGPWRSEPRSWPKEGAYPLFPYSNRIRDAAFDHAGRAVALRPHPAAAPHALHGAAHLRPWRVAQADAARAEILLDYVPDEDWPWPFQARQAFDLAEGGLTLHLSIRNDAEEPAPAGIGWHPYFSCAPQSVLRHDAGRLWRLGPDFIPDGHVASFAGETDDNLYLSEWTRAALVHADGSGVAIEAGESLGHLILHRPPGGGYACIEPVSHLADGFNLATKGIAGTGFVILEPGAVLSGMVRLALLPAPHG